MYAGCMLGFSVLQYHADICPFYLCVFFEKTDTQTDGLTVTKPMLYAFHYGLGQLNFGLLSYNLHYDSYQLL